MPLANRLKQKTTGAFYTPKELAHLLSCEVLNAWQALFPNYPLAQLMVLDPASGDGGLLIPFAQELAHRRMLQEPNTSQSSILEDIFNRQLFAADISAQALSIYVQKAKIIAPSSLPQSHTRLGNSLSCKKGKSVLQTLLPQKADILLVNPPYIGQKGHASLFQTLRKNPLWSAYVTPKNDLSYFFFYLALHMLKPKGIAGFITPPYFATAAGGKILRQTLQKEASCLRLINFEDKHLFAKVSPHTLLSVWQQGVTQQSCRVGWQTFQSVPQTDLFYGKDHFLQTRPVNTPLLTKMADAPYTLGEIAHVSNGLMTGCDQAFILTTQQKNAYSLTPQEKQKLKPFFKNSDISAYVAKESPQRWMIDFFFPQDRNLVVTDYPHLIAHLAQFKEKLLARKQNNNGIDKQLAQGKFWLGSVRRKMNFEKEKIVLPYRSQTVKAAYTKGPWYASSDVYFISQPSSPYTLWTLLGLLNSAPYRDWLLANGKRKGKLVELYASPLKQLPIPLLSAAQQKQLDALTQQIYNQKKENIKIDIENLQIQLDTFVASLF